MISPFTNSQLPGRPGSGDQVHLRAAAAGSSTGTTGSGVDGKVLPCLVEGLTLVVLLAWVLPWSLLPTWPPVSPHWRSECSAPIHGAERPQLEVSVVLDGGIHVECFPTHPPGNTHLLSERRILQPNHISRAQPEGACHSLLGVHCGLSIWALWPGSLQLLTFFPIYQSPYKQLCIPTMKHWAAKLIPGNLLRPQSTIRAPSLLLS